MTLNQAPAASPGNVTLTERVMALRTRPSPLTLANAIAAVAREGRTAEVAYGAYSMLAHRPSETVLSGDVAATAAWAQGTSLESEEVLLARYLSRFPHVARWLDGVPLRLHSVATVGRFTVAGEYGEGRARLFVMDEAGCRVIQHYDGVAGIRHLHCIHPVSDDAFVVTTGDSRRLADLWRVENGTARHVRTILRFFGGFTAAVRANGHDYFGSDYSGRPNYLWRMADGRRYFLPGDAFRMFVDSMAVVDDRYILVVVKRLETAGGDRAVVLFDAAIGRFVAVDRAA